MLVERVAWHPALATGGALASGKVGFADLGRAIPAGAAPVRYYDNVYVATPTPEPIAVYPGRSIIIGSASTKRYDSTGVYLGNPPSYVGSRFSLAPAGGVSRKNRVAIMARRNDIETTADDYIADSITAQVSYTPLYLNAPR